MGGGGKDPSRFDALCKDDKATKKKKMTQFITSYKKKIIRQH